MKKLWRLTVKEEVPAAHALRNYNGKCENLHGHNFTVELVVEGSILDETVEYLIDFTILKQVLKDITATLDHKVINDIPYFIQKNPTSENIAQYIYREAKQRLAIYETVRVYSVTIAERSIQNACYMELE
ncbi:MAG: 6-carboxytetrahydropterin synthase QueD [Desulfovibrionaceae bacterium]|nr:6-carboxytetrahydropterin synthase QueD [Desulfovibrionaceae bacterium]